MSRMEMMFSWLKYRSSFISRSVLKQNMEWSKGVIFLIATFWPDGLWTAELREVSLDTGGSTATNVANLPDNAIGAFANDILNIILLADIEGNLAGPAPVRCVAHPVPGGKACWRGS